MNIDAKTLGEQYASPIPRDGVFDHGSAGLTKRELFAAMVLQGLAARSELDLDSSRNAIYAVECADDLLAALAKDGA